MRIILKDKEPKEWRRFAWSPVIVYKDSKDRGTWVWLEWLIAYTYENGLAIHYKFPD